MNDPLEEQIHQIIQSAVQKAGGNWKQAFMLEVCQILAAVLVAQGKAS